ncbi:MAG: hypothetical protein ACE5LV_01820, partial [Candidatus Aminicenantales bacterium]
MDDPNRRLQPSPERLPVLVRMASFFVLILLFGRPFQAQEDRRVEIYGLRHFTHPTFTRVVVDIGVLREYVFNKLPSPDR